jgi:Zn-dependent peptidase ImmA (M78 family)
MPERHVRVAAARLQFDMADPTVDREALQSLQALAKRFGVSVQALSFRIANLNFG